ncbi:MAG: hypothetical protein QGI68_10145 [Pseudomonadales bacterium]|jgi:hypothetical protein|nr:hypothetical protein [Pseudomonadales bacterium]MDP7143930.1 hypothetical protein [Pseudomonadales bacterium]MDP7357337.1 hypothetical protein [Pseudomonadales bacterium]MDP7595914.1 hypothetical protein [Pseudomonadales bacterium]HJN49299.1 hypothetical protein [Pseudomonadales bacterium]|tara:strand:+ start:726 stop:1286 length:561 start_codon:yes stop_codon:yes gene_type:complete
MFEKARNKNFLVAALVLTCAALALGGRQADAQEKESTLKGDRFLDFDDIIVTTKEADILVPETAEGQDTPHKQKSRTLRIAAHAYCEKMERMDLEEYTAACREYVVSSLQYFAEDRNKFEGSVPAVSPEVRNHKNLPSIFGRYPENYASFPKDMMRRTLDMSMKDNLYTVTAIEEVSAESVKTPSP